MTMIEESQALQHFQGLKLVMADGLTNGEPPQVPSMPKGRYFVLQFEDFSFIAKPGSPEVGFQFLVPRGEVLGLTCSQVEKSDGKLTFHFGNGNRLWFDHTDADELHFGMPEVN